MADDSAKDTKPKRKHHNSGKRWGNAIKRIGRPSERIDRHALQQICELIAVGKSIKMACKMLQDEHPGDPKYPSESLMYRKSCLDDEIATMIARAEMRWYDSLTAENDELLRTADKDNWKQREALVRWREWLLERRHREKFGQQIQHDIKGQIEIVPAITINIGHEKSTSRKVEAIDITPSPALPEPSQSVALPDSPTQKKKANKKAEAEKVALKTSTGGGRDE